MGEKWTVNLHEYDDYVNHKDLVGSSAAVMPALKEIHFNDDDEELTLDAVLHELWHVFWSYRDVGSAEVSPHQMEEFSAVMFEEHGITMVRLARKLHKELVKRVQ